MTEWTDTCKAMHLGLWAIEPKWLVDAVAAVRAGLWAVDHEARTMDRPRLVVNGDGIAMIGIQGQLTKGQSKFGGTSSVQVRRQVREAAHDDAVRGIMLVVDSPGGFVAGTADLADDVWATRAEKPVRAHIDDLGASAAYWIASQAEHITAGKTAEIGSIGSMAVVTDSSGAAEREGIKVHVVSTGERKGDLIPGTPVTDEVLGDVRERVEAVNEHFLEAVARGRSVGEEDLSAWTSGRVWIASRAREMGLIDDVTTLEGALASFSQDLGPRPNFRSAIQQTRLENVKRRL